MRFKCYICEKLFENAIDIIRHMKQSHGIKEGADEIQCLVNNHCKKTYITVKGLKQHMKKCVPNQ